MLLTLVRHGESLGNLSSQWAGWTDSLLSHHGMNQAMKLGQYMSKTKIHTIFASDLMRARQTAEAIQSQNEAWGKEEKVSKTPTMGDDTKDTSGSESTKVPTIIEKNGITLWVTPLLREQHFGVIEGKSWLDGYTAYGGSNWREKRKFRTEQGESLEDVKARAERAIDHFILPELFTEMEDKKSNAKEDSRSKPETGDKKSNAKEGSKTMSERHVVLVAHGIFLSEIINALMLRQNPEAHHLKTGGMGNTARTTMQITARQVVAHSTPGDDSKTSNTYKRLPGAFVSTFADNTAGRIHIDKVEGLQIKLLKVADVSHLNNLKRQKGGIGSTAYDPKQRKLDFSP